MKILGIDIGTSAIKAAMVEVPTLRVLGTVANVGYELDHPTPEAAEVPAERLWESIVAAVRSAVGANGSSVEGVGLSVMTPALCLLNDKDQPLGPFWIHADRRSRPQARRVWQEVGDEFLAAVGTRPLPGGISALSWLCRRETEPLLSRRVRRYLHINGWAALRLTGQTAFDPANASFSGLANSLTDQTWSPRWCAFFGVEPQWLPPIQDGATTIGQLRAAVAAEFGVPPNIAVKLGTADTTCGMIAGRAELGDLYHTVGTTQVLATLTDQPHPGPKRLTRHFGVGAAFLHVTHNPVGGTALEWLRELCFRDVNEEIYYRQLVPSLIEARSAVVLNPPFLGGDRLQIDEALAGFQNLTLAHERNDLLTAVLTAMRDHHDKAVADLGSAARFRRVILSGRAAPIIRQMIYKDQDSKVELLEDGAVRGAAGLFAISAIS
jgi:xylulokinase